MMLPVRLTVNCFCQCSNLLQCTKKVIEAANPRFRNLTNPMYTPIVALKYADETGGLSVHAFYHMLFNMGTLMHISMSVMKYLTCGCLRSRTISPNWNLMSYISILNKTNIWHRILTYKVGHLIISSYVSLVVKKETAYMHSSFKFMICLIHTFSNMWTNT